MNEHIVEIMMVDDFHQEIVYKEIREEIVRCRDCRFFFGPNWDNCAFTKKYAHANGFCAWGERRGETE
jgi:hypothetical protein